LIGPLTDRTKSKLGRRKIYILVGAVLTSLLLVIFPFANNLSLLILLIILAGLTNSIAQAPYLAMITQNSSREKRSQTAAFMGILYLIGQIVMTVLALTFWKEKIDQNVFITLALLFSIPIIPLLIFSNDEKEPHHEEHYNFKKWLSFFTERSRNIYMLSQFILWFGINSVLPFFTLFAKNYLMLSQQKAILFYLVIVLASGAFAYPFSILGRKKSEFQVFQAGLIFLLAAGILGVFSKQFPEAILYIIALFAGIGNAATTAFSYSIFSKLVPESFIGTAGGVHSFLIAGFAPVAALTSGFLIGQFGYPIMFVIIALTTLVSIILLNNRPAYAD
jgi:MFS family permease